EELIRNLHEEGNKIIFMSHDLSKLSEIREIFDYVEYKVRWQVRDEVKENQDEHYLVVGANTEDMHLASSLKIALLNPLWCDSKSDKALYYGIHIPNTRSLLKVIQIINNQKSWFYELNVGENAKVYSLTSANSFNVGQSEKEMVEGFRSLLKKGNKKYFTVLQLHFLASLIHNPVFKEVDIWTVMPSSNKDYNDDIWTLKERARFLMGKQKKDIMFIRNKPIEKSHHINELEKRLYCTRHFESINLSKEYKAKIKGKTICVIDDYLNNGTSFESLRNLLLKAGVKSIIFVSLGKFKRSSGIGYFQQDYKLDGDIFSANYSYQLVNKQNLQGVYNDEARKEIEQLYEIIHG
ncbi:phosphoribosyltransferase, partial [Bacillus clausii]|uniref:phosphoribosyltransferase n=3 Tax=Bacillaceae TaxID=186817 RepID=UPI00145B1005